MMPATMWDDVIVGGGSTGAVIAARLSEERDRRVLLLEAGGPRVTAEPGPIGKPVLLGSNWPYFASMTHEGGREFPYSVGKVLGGSSAVNGAIALRALPGDFADWVAAGNDAWSWDQVLPAYVTMESDADMKGPEHGTDGPLPIRRMPATEFNTMAHAFHDGCRQLGLPDLPDLNAGEEPGIGTVPTNTLCGSRMSTADTYLAQAQYRPNLEIWTCCQADALLLRDTTVSGVRGRRNGEPIAVTAGRVTVCAGAVNSPLLLERSGIGAADRLAALGIRPVVDLPGVGENLSDHPNIGIWAVPRPGVCDDGPYHSVMGRLAGSAGRPDLILSMLNNVSTAGVPFIGEIMGGRTGITVAASLMSPASRGRVHLRDADPDGAPLIELGIGTDPADVRRLAEGTRQIWTILRSRPMADLVERVTIWTERMVENETMLHRSIPKFLASMWHPTGTARMGPEHDELAVVDQYCKVRGLSGLRVADASVFPFIPSAPTNLTCVMLGERVAGWMR